MECSPETYRKSKINNAWLYKPEIIKILMNNMLMFIKYARVKKNNYYCCKHFIFRLTETFDIKHKILKT